MLLLHAPFLGLLIILLLTMAATFSIFIIKNLKVRFKLLYFFILGVFSIGLYSIWGNPNGVAHLTALQKTTYVLESLSIRKNLKPAFVLEELKKCEKEIYYSHAALARLGTIYTQLGFFLESQAAFEKAISMAPKEKEYWIPFLYSYTLANSGKLPKEIRVRAESWVQQGSPPRTLLNLLAMDDYFQGRYSHAIQAWQLLLEMDKDLPIERKEVIQNAIKMAESHLKV